MKQETSPRVFVRQPSNPPEGVDAMALRAADDRGRPVLLEPVSSTSDASGTLQAFRLHPSPGARTFDLVYAVQRRRTLRVALPLRFARPADGIFPGPKAR